MNRFQRVLAACVGGLAVSSAAMGMAQFTNPAMPPSGAANRPQALNAPTMSPYMQLFQKNTGAVDNYNQFVRPQQQLNANLQRQDQLLRQQTTGLQSLTREVDQLNEPAQTRPDRLGPTGIGAGFMRYSHYYDFGSNTTGPGSAIGLQPASAARTIR